MRRWISVGARGMLAAALCGAMALWLCGDVAGVAAPGSMTRFAQSERDRQQVDVQLVLAVYISYSMDMDELATQREGYAEAITSREFLQALRQGPTGRIAITYFEWAGMYDQKIIIPWRLVDGPESAEAVATEIARTPVRRASRTSISAAIDYSVGLLEQSEFAGLRKVIDVSGDGANNQGVVVTQARDAALAKGIVINGLPIMMKQLSYATMDIPDLDIYFERCVTGGPGSFVLAIKERAKFKEAIRHQLLMEVAGRMPEPNIAPHIVPASVQGGGPRANVDCMIGEKVWHERWGGSRP